LGHDGFLCGFLLFPESFPVWSRFLSAAALATIARNEEIASSLVQVRMR
jgi:hypothetical protein